MYLRKYLPSAQAVCQEQILDLVRNHAGIKWRMVHLWSSQATIPSRKLELFSDARLYSHRPDSPLRESGL